MGRTRKKRNLIKNLHKWPSLIIAIFIILWAISGIVLNHRHTFSSFDINRNLLPAEHSYRNWNNASIRSSIKLDSNHYLFYGNVGVWKYSVLQDTYFSLNEGFPSGADHHKVNCLRQTDDGQLFAGTRFGLYKLNPSDQIWENISIPHHDKHVVDLLEINDSLWILTRSHLWSVPLYGDLSFQYRSIREPEGYDNKVGLFKTLWVIHSGEIYGLAGKLLVDFVALIFVFLTLSGMVYFFFPRWMKKRKKKSRPIHRIAFWNRWSLKWHNKIGIWLVFILLITTFTGMFLRPPLLIAIAQSRVNKIPYSMLDDGNPWYDQLRRILHDTTNEVIYLATSEGIYAADENLSSKPVRLSPQPPASVMGYNVIEFLPNGHILIGSFSGLYLWNPTTGAIYDYISTKVHMPLHGPAMPISENMVAGYHRDAGGHEFIFDYNKGVMPLRHNKSFTEMPAMISNSNMPLWNVALELHTARLLKPFIGDFYILFIPLFGLMTIIILISGVLLWVKKFNRKHKRK